MHAWITPHKYSYNNIEKQKEINTMAIYMKELTEKEREELSSEDLEKINGGYIYNGPHTCGQYEVIDDKTGDVLERFWLSADAIHYAKRTGNSTDYISWPELVSLRDTYQNYNQGH